MDCLTGQAPDGPAPLVCGALATVAEGQHLHVGHLAAVRPADDHYLEVV